MATQVPAIFNPENRFFYDDLLEMCVGTHTRGEVNSAILASVAFITTKSGMWIRKKEAENGSIYFEFASDLRGISPKHKVKIRSDATEDDDNITTTSFKLKELLLQASIKKVRYTDVNFRPYPPGAPRLSSKFFNLFLGFKAKPAEQINQNLVIPITRHIHEVWCAGDRRLTIYILNWLAFLIQKPDKKPGTAILMRSPPRCGKNILTDFIGERVLGRENFLSTTRLHDVMGKFNGGIRAKKLIVLNECDMTGSEWHGANNQLKSLITEPYISVEEKGIDTKVINDFAGYMICSNHAVPIRIELGDERFVALDVSDKYKGNRKYFNALLQILENPETPNAFMAYLLSRDLTNFNPREQPNTQMKQELTEASMPNPQRFIRYYVESDWSGDCDILEIPCTSLYNTYKEWCNENGESKTLSNNKFGMEIKQFAPRTRVRHSGNLTYCYILDRAKIAKKFDESFNIIPEREAQSDHKEDSPEVKAESSKTKIPETSETDLTEKKETPKAESPKKTPPVRKAPPPVPPKPDRLKVKVMPTEPVEEPVKTESTQSAPKKPDYEDLSAKDGWRDEELQKYLKRREETDPEPKQGTQAYWDWFERHKWDRKPWVEKSRDTFFNDLYSTGKELWAKYVDESDEYAWDILAAEVEECPERFMEGEYFYYFIEAVDKFKDWVVYNRNLPSGRTVERKELAEIIRVYQEDQNAEIIPAPSGYQTMKLDKGKAKETRSQREIEMEREWEEANGLVEEFDLNNEGNLDEDCELLTA